MLWPETYDLRPQVHVLLKLLSSTEHPQTLADIEAIAKSAKADSDNGQV